MELAGHSLATPRSAARALGWTHERSAAWLLGFAPVLYLALRGGGYDLVVRSEVGLAAWWIVLIGTACGVLRIGEVGRAGWTSLALLALLTLWTLFATGWSDSAERTLTEVGRLGSYVGFLALGLLTVRRGNTRQVVSGLATVFGLVGLLAVLSRIVPSAFPNDQLLSFFPGSKRLDYPLNYANANGEFLALGVPLLLVLVVRGRTIAGQALAAAAVPVLILGVVMCASRSGVLTAVVGALAFYALCAPRLPALASATGITVGTAALVVALSRSPAVRDGSTSVAAVSQRHSMLLVLALSCAGSALVQAAVGLGVRYAARPSRLRVPRRTAQLATCASALVLLVVIVAVGLPHAVSHMWSDFKQPNPSGQSTNVLNRLGTLNGSHRYQYWQVATNAFASHPVSGIGPGTFEYYWDEHAPLYEYVRNAHSLYLESLAEVGIVGGLLIVAFLLGALALGVRRTLRATPFSRPMLAGATASLAAFATCAAFDWVWQFAAFGFVVMLLVAIVVTGSRRTFPTPRDATWTARSAAVLVAIAASVGISLPLAVTESLRDSQAAVRDGNLRTALGYAISAEKLEPYAASPRLQQGLVLEQLHNLRAADLAISLAITREPTNWRLWLVHARIEAERGDVAAAVHAYQRAHALDPLSPATAIHG